MQSRQAILLLAHGGPDSLSDVAPFLAHIFKRPPSASLLAKSLERYELIGGFSPLKKVTLSLAQKVQEHTAIPTYVGMRHFHPFIADTMMRMHDDGIREATVICLAPHFSNMSIGAYKRAVGDANAKLESPLELRFIDSWHANNRYVQSTARLLPPFLKEGRGGFGFGSEFGSGSENENRSEIPLSPPLGKGEIILFTAHSLPARILDDNDPYVAQLEESARLIAKTLDLPPDSWRVAFQSASPSSETWLSPSAEEALEDCAKNNIHRIIYAPIGFVAEHVEILYDVDIALQAHAKKLGVQFSRIPMLNDSEDMVHIIADIFASYSTKICYKEMV